MSLQLRGKVTPKRGSWETLTYRIGDDKGGSPRGDCRQSAQMGKGRTQHGRLRRKRWSGKRKTSRVLEAGGQCPRRAKAEDSELTTARGSPE